MSGVLDKIEWTHLDFVRRFHFAVALCLVSAVVWLFAETVNLQSVFYLYAFSIIMAGLSVLLRFGGGGLWTRWSSASHFCGLALH